MESKRTIFQFVEKLKEINVNEVIEKSKNITIEDIQNINWKDIKSSKFTRPVTGIFLFFLFIFIFLIPEIKTYNSKKVLSKVSSTKSINLKKLEDNLEKSLLIKSILDSNFEEFSNLTADKSKLINLTDLITDAAKRSLVDIQEFSPISERELSSCQASQGNANSELESLGFNPNNGFGNFQGEIDPNQSFIDDNVEVNPLEELKTKLDYIDNNNNYLRFSSPKTKSKDIPKKLNNNFDSNYFKIEVVADFINLLNFLRSIQEYRIIIVPMCFEPSLLTPSGNVNQNQISGPTGIVRARLFVDVPTYK